MIYDDSGVMTVPASMRRFLFENSEDPINEKAKRKADIADIGDTDVKDIDSKDKNYKVFNDFLETVRDDNYEGFVKQLQSLEADPKLDRVIHVIRSMFDSGKGVPEKDKGALQYSANVDIQITNIHPTQYEIDIDKSLKYPLTNPKSLHDGLVGMQEDGSGLVCGPAPILVALIGKTYYVIDGHHRWSQVYMLNPKAMMKAFVIKSRKFFNSPDDILKMVQVEILTKTGKIPTQHVEGKNMLTISDKEITDYVKKTAKPNEGKILGVIRDFDMNTIDDLAARIVENKNIMKEEAPKTFTAHNRGVMPQCPGAIPHDDLLTAKTPPKLSESQGRINMGKYTRKQIQEAIAYWKKQIAEGNYRKVNEAEAAAGIKK